MTKTTKTTKTNRTMYTRSEFSVREDAENNKKFITGRFIVYGTETEIFDGWFEKINKAGVENAIKDADVRALFNHDDSLVLGRTSNNTLKLESKADGLHAEIEVNENDPQAVGAYERIKRGDVSGASFGFWPTKVEDTIDENGALHEEILELEIHEISPCTFPAYKDTEISSRSKIRSAFESKQDNKEKETLKLRKIEFKERFKKWL